MHYDHTIQHGMSNADPQVGIPIKTNM